MDEVNLFKCLEQIYPLESIVIKICLIPATSLLNRASSVLINAITRTLKWSRFGQLPAQIKKTSKVNLPKGYEPSSIKSFTFVSKAFPVWLLEQSAVPLECFHSHLRVFWRSPGRKHCHRCSHEDQSFPQCLGSLALGPWLKIIVLLAKLIIQGKILVGA